MDLRLQLGTQEYAIEHTQIEAFRRQIATGVSLMQLIDPVKQALCGELPGPAIYEMIFPIDPSLDVAETGLEQLQENLINGHWTFPVLRAGRAMRSGQIRCVDITEECDQQTPQWAS